ncbi:MAG TPA: hypothetical protein VEJ87_03830 [Acidimicrobiales bacterium]|nr:hypothetical protein [Acidimicrobiales bacterium]
MNDYMTHMGMAVDISETNALDDPALDFFSPLSLKFWDDNVKPQVRRAK